MTKLLPGLYKATVRGVPNQLVMVSDATYPARSFTVTCDIGGEHVHTDNQITDAHPLIVLDITRGMARAVVEALSGFDEVQANRIVIEQIKAQIQSPRIPEPGLWGVVEANTEASPTRCRYGRTRPDSWVREGFSAGWHWSELIDPVLIREGI